tara:strand:+ start:5101 stop:5559 length:459 start_codon:yes stop_codon:yes gene_type:complete
MIKEFTDFSIMKQYLPKKYIINAIENLCVWQRDIDNLRTCLCNMANHGMFLDTKIAKKMLRDMGPNSCRKAKYILPFVLDTWNITEEAGFNKLEVGLFQKSKLIIKNNIPDIRLRYHKNLISKLVVRDEGLYDPIKGYFTKDNECTNFYECY